ncbi:MAG: ABC transporter ATP-binding protein [Acidimicrobiia bacterium]
MPVIEVEDLVKTYDGVNVVDGVSFSVEEGEIFGIVGPNGAGKTTTVECVEGLRRPDDGSIQVLGLDPILDRYEITERVGAQLQESRLQDKITVAEALELYSSFYEDPADWRELLDRLGLQDKVDARYAKLSGGQKQRLAIALALVGSPEIAVLDELTTGLDPQARRSMWDTIEEIRKGGVTVVLVTHFMEEAERLCDRVMVVDHGRVVAIDSPSGLIRRVGSEQRLTFRPSRPIEDEAFTNVPDIATVERSGSDVVITGTGNLVHTVTAILADRQIIAEELRVEQTSLEDAYLELTSQGGGSAEAELEAS